MSDYRRPRIAGGTYFFTLTLEDRSLGLLVDQVAHLRAALRVAVAARPFTNVAMVVLPDHLHAIWTLPAGDTDYATRWAHIKAGFSRALARGPSPRASLTRKRERGIWQRRFWEHAIRGERDLAAHVDYIHINPVKHGLVERATDWPWSSIHRYVRDGLLAKDWAMAPAEMASVRE